MFPFYKIKQKRLVVVESKTSILNTRRMVAYSFSWRLEINHAEGFSPNLHLEKKWNSLLSLLRIKNGRYGSNRILVHDGIILSNRVRVCIFKASTSVNILYADNEVINYISVNAHYYGMRSLNTI